MTTYRTFDDTVIDYFTEHPEEIDEFVSGAYVNYVEDGETAVLQSILRSVAPAKGVTSISISEAALISETVLARDWNRTEEDEAWSHLQHEQLS